jgi:hypothetical protein
MIFRNLIFYIRSLIVARKSAESGELTLGQPPHRNNTLKGTGIKKTAVRPKGGGGTGMPSATLRAAPNTAGKANANKNVGQNLNSSKNSKKLSNKLLLKLSIFDVFLTIILVYKH